jgi:hypothetical protein
MSLKLTTEYNGQLNPCFVTGFTDAEGCFHLSINKDSRHKIGWKVRLGFEIHLHIKDLPLLKMFKEYFGVGFVTPYDSIACFRVQSFKDLPVIVKHF